MTLPQALEKYNDKAQRRESSSVLWSRMFYFSGVTCGLNSELFLIIYSLYHHDGDAMSPPKRLASVGRQAAGRAVLGVFDEYSLARCLPGAFLVNKGYPLGAEHMTRT